MWSHLREVGRVFYLDHLCSVFILLTVPTLQLVTIEFVKNAGGVRARERISANKCIALMTEFPDKPGR